MPMSQHDWRNWETCKCGEPGCRSSYPNRKWKQWKQMNEDPIAAHLTELIADAPAPNHEEDNYDAGYVAALADLRDSAAFKLVVEQHTNGRIAELEATIARVIEGAQMLVESFQRVERGGNHLYDASTHRCADNLALLLAEAQGPEHLRAALEGES